MPVPSADAIQRAQLRAVATSFLRTRPWVVAPAMAVTLLALWLSPAPRTQLYALGAGFTLMLSFFLIEAWRGRHHEVTQRGFFQSLLATTLGISLGSALTGGLSSPLLPLYFAPAITVFAAFGRGVESRVMGVTVLVLVALLGFLPEGFPFPAPVRSAAQWITAATIAATLMLLVISVSGLTGAYRRSSYIVDQLRSAALESAQGRARSLESMSSQLAHELKNPLSSIRGLSQLLLKRASGSDVERLRVLESEASRLQLLIDEYLSFSRPLDELAPAEVELGEVIDYAMLVLEPRARERQVELARASGPPARLRADARRLREALINLLANAIDACEAGGSVVIALRASETETELLIEDDGQGMAPEVLERAGTAFFTTKPGGTGLGLLIAKAAVQQHGGRLEVSSEPGQGTRVVLRFPVEGG